MMTGAFAAAVNEVDAQAIQAVVQSQLDAFSNDDATGAFGFATLSTQRQIGSADNFMTLVRELYRPIYRHRLAIFSPAEIIDEQVIQTVRLSDPDSKVWIAVYWMQREVDGNWRIDNCQLLATQSVSI